LVGEAELRIDGRLTYRRTQAGGHATTFVTLSLA
jgi:hypothetical protein